MVRNSAKYRLLGSRSDVTAVARPFILETRSRAKMAAIFFTSTGLKSSKIWPNPKIFSIKYSPKHEDFFGEKKLGVCCTFNMKNIESYNIAKIKGLKHSNFLVWTWIRQAILHDLKRLKFNENKLNSLEFPCGEKRFIPLISRSTEIFFMNCLFREKQESQEVLLSGKRDFAWTTQMFFKAFLNL